MTPTRTLAALAARTPPRDTIPTGFPSVDNALGGGVRRGDLIVLAGEVGSGKSALALAIALRARESGHSVALASAEMDTPRLAERALAIEGRARVDDLRRGTLDEETQARVSAAATQVERALPELIPFPLDGARELGAADSFPGDTELLIVDPLQGLAAGTGGGALDEQIAAAARALKAIAIDRDVAVLVTSHLPALPRDRKDPRPHLDDLGGPGAVKQFADVVLGLFRQEMYDTAPDVDGATELLILKNRNGALGYVDLFFYKQWMRFEDMLEPDR